MSCKLLHNVGSYDMADSKRGIEADRVELSTYEGLPEPRTSQSIHTRGSWDLITAIVNCRIVWMEWVCVLLNLVGERHGRMLNPSLCWR